jgi:diacylglycerol kinase (ATP)
MRVTLLHNPSAGEEAITPDDLLDALRTAGHDPTLHSTDAEGGLERVQDPGDVLLAVGGDGTVRKLALALGLHGPPVAVLPLGTANNVARSLGLPASLDDVIASLEGGSLRPVDVGIARSGGAERHFIESVGVGLFAEGMALVDAHVQEDVARTIGADAERQRDLRLLKTLLQLHRAGRCRAVLDGDPVTGDMLLVEAMNMRCFGPNLCLAPDADPGDGLLDVVLVDDADRPALSAYLDDRIAGLDPTPARFRVRRAAHVRLEWHSPIAHTDDLRWPSHAVTSPDEALVIEMAVLPGALRFIGPAHGRGTALRGGEGRRQT